MQCPKCDGELKPIVQDNIEVDKCDNCGGLWFDMREADRLLKQGNAAKLDSGAPDGDKQQNEQKKVECPRCHTPMIHMVDLEQHHIWYESCSVCYGKWFDAGEFADLGEKTIFDFFRGILARERS